MKGEYENFIEVLQLQKRENILESPILKIQKFQIKGENLYFVVEFTIGHLSITK